MRINMDVNCDEYKKIVLKNDLIQKYLKLEINDKEYEMTSDKDILVGNRRDINTIEKKIIQQIMDIRNRNNNIQYETVLKQNNENYENNQNLSER